VSQPPILCYVTDRGALRPKKVSLRGGNVSRSRDTTDASGKAAGVKDEFTGLLEKIGEIAAAGVDWIQIREKDLSGRALARLIRTAIERTATTAGATRSTQESAKRTTSLSEQFARILVNDGVDVALAEGAHGVHLGEGGLPVRDVRDLAQRILAARNSEGHFLVGCSCHSMEAAQCAADDGADYVFFGPIFATPSKFTYGEPQGLARLAEVCRAVSIPVLAIGGISIENAEACLNAGAAGIAAIRMFQDAGDTDSSNTDSGETDSRNAKEVVAALRALKS
jgi:thiamine-phosphate pyrophosphorylase